jgi:hypothetical protein
VLLGAITLDLFAVLFGGAVALLPIYARDILHTGPEGLGLLRAAPSLGALVTAIALAHVPVRRHAGRTLYIVVALFGLATAAFAVSTNFWLSMVRLRGRVSAAEYVFIGASNQLGELESGLTASWWGAVTAVLVGGLASVLVVAVSALLTPALRRVDRVEDLRAQADSAS